MSNPLITKQPVCAVTITTHRGYPTEVGVGRWSGWTINDEGEFCLTDHQNRRYSRPSPASIARARCAQDALTTAKIDIDAEGSR